MKLLVTGGSGFIGGNFVFYWLRKNPSGRLVNLDLMTYCANPRTVDRQKREFGDRYEFVAGDICDEALVDRLVAGVDAVVHFAAESHVDRSVTAPHEFVRTNVLGTQTLLDAARRHGKKRFHHVSTDEVYGTLELGSSEKFRESTPFSPRSPYSASKAGSDHLAAAYFETYGLPVTITNCSNNYGPYHFPEKVIPLYVTRAMQGKPFPIYGEGKAVRDYLYVEDHCRAIDLVLERGRLGETYCVGGDSERNTVEVARAVLGALGASESLKRHTVDRPGHDPRYAIDHSKLTSELGWNPSVSFEEGVRLTVEWYRANEEWWRPISAKAEEVAEKYLANAR